MRIAAFLNNVIFFSLLTIIALTAIPYGTVEPWLLAVSECLIFCLALLALIEAFIGRSMRLGGLRLVAPLLALTLFILAQSLSWFPSPKTADLMASKFSMSADPYGSRLVVVKLLTLIVTALLLVRYTSTKRRLNILIGVVIGIGLASAIFGFIRWDFQQGPGFLLPRLTTNSGFAQFINKNHFAFLMEMTLGLSLGLMLEGIGRLRTRLVLIPLVGVFWVALISSNSRGGILASFGQLIFLFVLLDPIRHLTEKRAKSQGHRMPKLATGFVLRTTLIASLVLLFAYGVSWVGGEPVVNNFESMSTNWTQDMSGDKDNNSRRQFWAITWQLIKDHPLVGVGFGGYWIGITKYHQASGKFALQQVHNDYLEILASGGLIGGALVLWFIIAFICKAQSTFRSSEAPLRAARLGALTGIFGVFLHSFVDFGLHVTINSLIFVALVVIAIVELQQEKDSLLCEMSDEPPGRARS